MDLPFVSILSPTTQDSPDKLWFFEPKFHNLSHAIPGLPLQVTAIIGITTSVPHQLNITESRR